MVGSLPSQGRGFNWSLGSCRIVFGSTPTSVSHPSYYPSYHGLSLITFPIPSGNLLLLCLSPLVFHPPLILLLHSNPSHSCHSLSSLLTSSLVVLQSSRSSLLTPTPPRPPPPSGRTSLSPRRVLGSPLDQSYAQTMLNYAWQSSISGGEGGFYFSLSLVRLISLRLFLLAY